MPDDHRMSKTPLLEHERDSLEAATSDDYDLERLKLEGQAHLHPQTARRRRARSAIHLAVLVGAGFLVGAITGGLVVPSWPLHQALNAPGSCVNPSTRVEWRSLSAQQQDDYLSAVDCLRTSPSKLGLNHSRHNDFPYVHQQTGGYSHHSAPFLAWHRYFIHLYETALREECDYPGHLTYWDWTLDWKNLTQAPIWSNASFGGNGNPEAGQEVMLGGYCVTDGRFANTEVPFLNQVSFTHCLSRGFVSGDMLTGNGSLVNPLAIEHVLRADTYEAFNLGLEDTGHDAIPHFIRGDFRLFTAPADPVFFLHHAQLDRLWRLWQERDPANRLWQFNGVRARNVTDPASIDDMIPMAGLAPDVRVRDIMDTKSGFLCYN